MKLSDIPQDPSAESSFEAQTTAWIDGCLPESERAAFEAECERRGIPPAEREADRLRTRQLGRLLRSHAMAIDVPHALAHPDFFNAQLLRQIDAETPCPESAPFPWPLRRLAFGGLASLGAAALLFAALVFPALHRPGPPPEYYARILNSQTTDPAISAVAMHLKSENVPVLWIDGLDYVPAEKAKN